MSDIQIHPFRVALSHVWRLNLPKDAISAQQFGQSMAFVPLAALLLGLTLTLVGWLLSHYVSPEVNAALLLVFLLKMTGATTLDGLARVGDATLTKEPSDISSLLQQPKAPIAVVGIALVVLTLVLKWALLVQVISEGWWILLVLMPVVGWSFGQMLMLGSRWVQNTSLVDGWRKHVALSWLWPQWLLLFTALALTSGWTLTVLIIGTWAWIVWWRKHLGGITEAVALSWVESSELILLLGMVMVLSPI
jgi:adenosylcobinamide-GDP ribazoletransferase